MNTPMALTQSHLGSKNGFPQPAPESARIRAKTEHSIQKPTCRCSVRLNFTNVSSAAHGWGAAPDQVLPTLGRDHFAICDCNAIGSATCLLSSPTGASAFQDPTCYAPKPVARGYLLTASS
ncbi:hypothetical protein PC120_g2561 [Phytophthora cactorum]|nr:hypothetical protein PC120_g2561 [Phytophthora cactorum]